MTNPTFGDQVGSQNCSSPFPPFFVVGSQKCRTRSGQVPDFLKKNKGPKNRFQRQPEKTLPHLRFTYQNLLAASGPASPKRSEPEMLRYIQQEKKKKKGQNKAIHYIFPLQTDHSLLEMHLNPTVYGLFSRGGTYHIPRIQ